MRYDTLIVEFDDHDGWIILQVRRHGGAVTDQSSFELPRPFTPEHVQQALVATGWVQQRGAELIVSDYVGCESLAETIVEMFRYFQGPETPAPQLQRVRQAATHYLPGKNLSAIPLWAFAWLDLMVRADLADDARSTTDLWEQSELVLPIEQHARYRFGQLAQRYALTEQAPTRQAPTIRKRRRDKGQAGQGG